MAETAANTPGAQVPATIPREILKLRAQNKHRSINTVPAEVLSRIFAIGHAVDHMEESLRTEQSRKGTPVLVSHVCSLWRDVAIGSASLWTFIHIARPPHNIALLYLKRAGPTALLDIYFDLRAEYWKSVGISVTDAKRQISHIPEMIRYLVSHGGGIHLHRWRSLRVCITHWEALIPFVSIANSVKAPALHSMSLERELTAEAWIKSRGNPETVNDSFRISGSSMPNLKELDLHALPLGIISRRSSATFLGLTRLSLITGHALFTPSNLGDCLSANPQLQSLEISTGATTTHDFTLTTQRICLRSLNSLTFRTSVHAAWVMYIIHMIDAPALHKFAIECPPSDADDTANNALAAYIEGEETYHRCLGLTKKHFYPSIRELDISSFSCEASRMASMLASLPQITHLTICGHQATHLGDNWWILPNLVSLKFTRLVYPQLGSVLRRRADAGYPITVVHVHKDFRLHVWDPIPETVEIRKYEDPLFQAIYQEMEREADFDFEGEDSSGYGEYDEYECRRDYIRAALEYDDFDLEYRDWKFLRNRRSSCYYGD